MDIKPCDIDLTKCADTIMGGGILPFTILNGKLMLLLAQERQVMHWRGSQKWSGFEGGRKSEEDIITTASREFQEESLAIVNVFHSQDKYASVEDISDALRSNDFDMKIVLRVFDDTKQRENVTFLKYMAYDKYVDVHFTSLREQLVTLFHMLQKFDSIVISNDFPNFSTNYDGLDIFIICDVFIQDSEMIVKYIDSDMTEGLIHSEICYTYFHQMKNKLKILQAIQVFMDLHPDLESHPSLKNARSIHELQLNPDFLEKQMIRYWPIEELEKVIKNGGFVGEDVFRAYFIPVLQTVLQHTTYLVDKARKSLCSNFTKNNTITI